MNLYQKYMLHIDNLRISMRMKEKDFVVDICSDRQYRRYLSGDSQGSQRTINKFCEKLRITPNDFYSSFHRENDHEYREITQIYHSIQYGDIKSASLLIEEFSNHHFISVLSKDFYEFCCIYYRSITKQISNSHAHILYSKLINYPTLLSKDNLSFIELIALMKIASIESKKGKYIGADYLMKLLSNSLHFYISSNNRYILPSLYVELTKIYWNKKAYEISESLIDNGINFSLKNHDTSALSELYYLKAYLRYTEKDKELSYSFASKCLNLLLILGQEKKYVTYYKILLKDFKQPYIDKLRLLSLENNDIIR